MKKKSNKDKWGKKQVFIMEVAPYKQEVIVVLNGQFSDALKLLKKIGSPSAKEVIKHVEDSQKKDKEAYIDNYINNNGSAFTYTQLPKGYIVLLSHEDTWIDTVNSVTHECLHLTHYILRRARVILCEESEEAYTYLQAQMVTDILTKMY